jgi:hypothetical protein
MFKSPTFIVGPVRCTQTRRYFTAVAVGRSGRATATTVTIAAMTTPGVVNFTSRDIRRTANLPTRFLEQPQPSQYPAAAPLAAPPKGGE